MIALPAPSFFFTTPGIEQNPRRCPNESHRDHNKAGDDPLGIETPVEEMLECRARSDEATIQPVGISQRGMFYTIPSNIAGDNAATPYSKGKKEMPGTSFEVLRRHNGGKATSIGGIFSLKL